MYQREDLSVSFRPDACCHLRVPYKESHASLLAYLEVDRSTEGHLQWKKKLLGIEAFLEDKVGFRPHWPDVSTPAVVILVLCKTPQRIANLIETTRNSPASANIRFTAFPLDPTTVLVGDVWQDCDGELKRILKGE